MPTELARSQSGNAAIEFALTFPTLVVVTLMIFDFGQGLLALTTVNNSAAAGARYAAVHGAENLYAKTENEIATFVVDRAAGLDPDKITVTITYSPGNSSGAEVQVRVDYTLELFVSGVFENILTTGTTWTLSGTSTMNVL